MIRGEEKGISVVMPAYNAEGTIGKAIESVLAQTYVNLELIVVNDRSADSTEKVVSSFCAADQRVRLITNEKNSGVAVSRNVGVAAARYPWIAFLDSDDYWLPEKLERQMKALGAHPECSISFTATAYLKPCGSFSPYVLNAPDKVTREDILKQNVISCSSVVVKKEALLRCPMPNDRRLHEDYAVWLEILKPESGKDVPYALGVNEPLLVYRLSPTGKSGNKRKAAEMQWRTYRYCRIPLLKAMWCFLVYTIRNVRKYRKIKS